MPDDRNPRAYPCPCCGHLVFDEPPGSNDICLICFWEDDLAQLRWPGLAGGANVPSLREAQVSYLRFGAIEERFRDDVRKPLPTEQRDPDWRPISDHDVFEAIDDTAPWPEDTTQFYYWLRSAPTGGAKPS